MALYCQTSSVRGRDFEKDNFKLAVAADLELWYPNYMPLATMVAFLLFSLIHILAVYWTYMPASGIKLLCFLSDFM